MHNRLKTTGTYTLTTPKKYLNSIYFPTIYRIRIAILDDESTHIPRYFKGVEEVYIMGDEKDLPDRLDYWQECYLEDREQPLFIVHELPMYSIMKQSAHLRERIYDGKELLSESLCAYNDSKEIFLGRPQDKILFNKGDIVTIVNDDSLTAGIILRQPLSVEEMAIRFDAHRSEMLETIDPNSETAEWRICDSFPYDYKDDCYEALLFVDNGSLAKKTIPSSRVIPSVYANLPISYHHAEILEEAFRKYEF